MRYLEAFIRKVWDGDLSFEDATEEFTQSQLKKMDEFLKDHQILFKDGMPEDFNLPAWIADHPSGKLIIELVRLWEE